MKKSILVTFLFVAFFVSLKSAYLNDIPMELHQPDGTVFSCYASGDEFHNWLHDSENYTIIQNKHSGYYTYAQKSGSRLEPTEYIVGRVNPNQTRLSPGLNIDENVYYQMRRDWFQDTPRTVRTPTSGIINNLVVFIRFSDQTEFTEPLTTYNTMFNSPAPTVNSMYNYFMETSYQALSIYTTFYPLPVNHMVVSYQDSLPRNYYMPYSSTNTIGYNGSTERREREHTLLVNAVNYISDSIPPDLILDADNDGKVDNVCFLIKGGTGAWADLLWPHMWSLYTYEVFLNGARVYTYNFNLETSLTSSGVGVLCHEMSHSIGMPDLYHYTSNGITPLGRWDIMESNRNPPQHHTSYLKARYTDWLPPVRQITQPGIYWVNKMRLRDNNCYKIASNNPQYYYMVEFRKQEGVFEPSLPGTGLIITRIDTAADGQGNASGPPDELYAYRPGGTTTVNGTILSAHYSLEVNRTALNSTTNPTPFLADGTQGGLNITQIGSSAGDSISFYVSMPPVSPVDYDEGFESGDFTAYNWTLSGDSDWEITDSDVYQGAFSARSGFIDHLQSSTMTMTVNVPVNGHIAFYKRVSSERNYDFLKFYIDDVQKGQFSGNSNWSYVQYAITPGVHSLKWTYIKDQGVSSGSDCAWVDNILFRWDAPSLHPAPDSLIVTSLSDDIGVQLNWQIPQLTSSTLQGYRIFKNNVQIADIDTTNLSYTDFNVLTGNTYSYFLKAFYTDPHGHSFSTDTLSVLVSYSPVIPVILNVEVVDTNDVAVYWELPEIHRGVTGFDIYRNGEFITTVSEPSARLWIDYDLDAGIYHYQVATRYVIVISDLSEPMLVIVEEVVTNDEPVQIPLTFGLDNIYPNPFNTNTLIMYNIDKSDIQIFMSVFNIKGQKVKTLFVGKAKSGTHRLEWNGLDQQGNRMSSGIYFIRLQSPDRVETKKVLLLK